MEKVTFDRVQRELSGSRLKERREAMDMTQRDLGDMLGYHAKSIGRFERGEQQIPRQFAEQFERHVGNCTAEYLLLEDDFYNLSHKVNVISDIVVDETAQEMRGILSLAEKAGYKTQVFNDDSDTFLISKDGITINLSLNEILRLHQDIAELVRFRFDSLFRWENEDVPFTKEIVFNAVKEGVQNGKHTGTQK